MPYCSRYRIRIRECRSILTRRPESQCTSFLSHRFQIWTVSVDQQESPRFITRLTSYAPPVTAEFSGPGASGAQTYGNEAVVISGLNFGPAGTVVDYATYGPGNGTDLVSPGCILSIPQTQIVCNT
jgi:hypothetical protein